LRTELGFLRCFDGGTGDGTAEHLREVMVEAFDPLFEVRGLSKLSWR
jgi:hypothetical protein